MKREALIREIKKLAKKRDLAVAVDFKSGKGSHSRITVGGRKTTIAHGEISPKMARLIIGQLGLDQ